MAYEDLRDRLCRGLWKDATLLTDEEWKLRQRSHLIRAIVSIGLHESPLRSVKQASKLHYIGEKVVSRLKNISRHRFQPLPCGVFSSAAAAALVTLLEIGRKSTSETKGASLCPLAALVDGISRRLPPEQKILTSKQILEGKLCACWEQLKPMKTGSWSKQDLRLIKERRRNKQKVYQLTKDGRKIAERLIRESSSRVKLNARGPLHSRIGDGTLGSCKGGTLVLLLDSREGGGEDYHLSDFAQAFRRRNIAFETRVLPTGMGDYVFVFRSATGDEKVVPIVIERKTSVDLASGMRDGRWERQNMAMKIAIDIFHQTGFEKLDNGVSTEMRTDMLPEEYRHAVYLLQGTPIAFNCGCGCRCVGGCGELGYPTLEHVESTLKALENGSKPFFMLKRVRNSLEACVEFLADIHKILTSILLAGAKPYLSLSFRAFRENLRKMIILQDDSNSTGRLSTKLEAGGKDVKYSATKTSKSSRKDVIYIDITDEEEEHGASQPMSKSKSKSKPPKVQISQPHGDDPSSSSVRLEKSKWNCFVCTYRNRPLALACEMCGTTKGHKNAAPLHHTPNPPPSNPPVSPARASNLLTRRHSPTRRQASTLHRYFPKKISRKLVGKMEPVDLSDEVVGVGQDESERGERGRGTGQGRWTGAQMGEEESEMPKDMTPCRFRGLSGIRRHISRKIGVPPRTDSPEKNSSQPKTQHRKQAHYDSKKSKQHPSHIHTPISKYDSKYDSNPEKKEDRIIFEIHEDSDSDSDDFVLDTILSRKKKNELTPSRTSTGKRRPSPDLTSVSPSTKPKISRSQTSESSKQEREARSRPRPPGGQMSIMEAFMVTKPSVPGKENRTRVQFQEKYLRTLKLAELKRLCRQRGEKLSGKKGDLIKRLLRPPLPSILQERSRSDLYIPKPGSINRAILVELEKFPNQQGSTKEEIMRMADNSEFTNSNVYERRGGGAAFPGSYDGWSGSTRLTKVNKGDEEPFLVILVSS
ncbi:hypothetical protein AAMO2058_001038300 [Amorphochlora amoebiformis]